MPHQLVVTAGTTGPGRVLSNVNVPNVTKIEFDLNDKIMSVYTDPSTGTTAREFDLAVTNTVTVSITAGNYTVTIT